MYNVYIQIMYKYLQLQCLVQVFGVVSNEKIQSLSLDKLKLHKVVVCCCKK